ncbi:hypothetical protein IWX49DRAFT_643256, partial [Phyllosticta citricarpa]
IRRNASTSTPFPVAIDAQRADCVQRTRPCNVARTGKPSSFSPPMSSYLAAAGQHTRSTSSAPFRLSCRPTAPQYRTSILHPALAASCKQYYRQGHLLTPCRRSNNRLRLRHDKQPTAPQPTHSLALTSQNRFRRPKHRCPGLCNKSTYMGKLQGVHPPQLPASQPTLGKKRHAKPVMHVKTWHKIMSVLCIGIPRAQAVAHRHATPPISNIRPCLLLCPHSSLDADRSMDCRCCARACKSPGSLW